MCRRELFEVGPWCSVHRRSSGATGSVRPSLQTVSPEVDAVVHELYADVLGPYWPPEIRHIEDGYSSLPFPFDEITPQPFRLVQTWDADRLAAYMATWSGSQRYRKVTGRESAR